MQRYDEDSLPDSLALHALVATESETDRKRCPMLIRRCCCSLLQQGVDLWAIGIFTYELLTARVPFRVCNLLATPAQSLPDFLLLCTAYCARMCSIRLSLPAHNSLRGVEVACCSREWTECISA